MQTNLSQPCLSLGEVAEIIQAPAFAAIGWREPVLGRQQWEELIAEAKEQPIARVEAIAYRGQKASSHSGAVLLVCDDRQDYFVKGKQQLRSIANERIVGFLANHVGAPVPAIQLVNVSQALIDGNPDMRHMPAGLCHGAASLFPRITDKIIDIRHALLAQNRSRYALLAFLYGLIEPQEPQYFYEKNSPELIWSLDHGHSFPGGPIWEANRLAQSLPATPFHGIASACNFTLEETTMAKRSFATITNRVIAATVASPPDEWNFPLDLRLAAAEYIHRRLRDLLQDGYASST